MAKSRSGHRQRLRERFLTSGAHSFTEAELLELLLTYAIPRRDVGPVARELLERLGSLPDVLGVAPEELTDIPGIGEQAAVLIKLVGQLAGPAQGRSDSDASATEQPLLFDTEPELGPLFDEGLERSEPQMRTFANDEIANSLVFIPQAAQFKAFEGFKAHLRERLPYNSESTRERRANYILARFFPQERLDVPLTHYAAHCSGQEDLKPIIFYHVLKAELLAAKVAEELVWPAVPIGRVEREGMREFILLHLPHIGSASQTKALRSLFATYDLLSIGTQDGTTLRFQMHAGTLEAFLYVLCAEFPERGVYTFEALEQGPMRLWLLWDRGWMHQQLYNLRDLGIISKVSEIDRIRQFTLQFDQWTALRNYFERPQGDRPALRDQPTNLSS